MPTYVFSLGIIPVQVKSEAVFHLPGCYSDFGYPISDFGWKGIIERICKTGRRNQLQMLSVAKSGNDRTNDQ